jgi:hypothetical protein
MEKTVLKSFHLNNLVESFNKTGVVLKPLHHNVEAEIKKDIIVYTPTTTVSSSLFSSGGEVRFRIGKGSCGKILHGIIELTCSESGGSATVTAAPSPLFIERIEYYGQNGGKLIQTQYGDNLFLNLGTLTNEQLQTLVNIMNTSTSWGAGSAITASETRIYYVPVFGAWWESVHPCMQSLEDLLVKITFQSSKESGSGTLSASNVRLLIESEAVDSKEEIAFYQNLYHNRGFEAHFVDNVRIQFTQSFGNSTAYTFRLAQLLGKCGSLWFFLRSSESNTSGGFRTFTALSSSTNSEALIELLDGANKNINGGSALTSSFIRFHEFANYFPSQMTNSIAIYIMSFGDPMQHMHGNHIGYKNFTTNESLKITTAGSGRE